MPFVNQPGSDWQDLYALAGGLPANTVVLIQNQSSYPLRVRDDLNDSAGTVIPQFGQQECTGRSILQAKCFNGLLCSVQVSS